MLPLSTFSTTTLPSADPSAPAPGRHRRVPQRAAGLVPGCHSWAGLSLRSPYQWTQPYQTHACTVLWHWCAQPVRTLPRDGDRAPAGLAGQEQRGAASSCRGTWERRTQSGVWQQHAEQAQKPHCKQDKVLDEAEAVRMGSSSQLPCCQCRTRTEIFLTVTQKCCVWHFCKHAREQKERRAPAGGRAATAHCAPERASGQLRSHLWPNPGSPGHRAGQRPKGKGQSRGAETKLCQLIHTNLFKSFWVAGQTDMGEQDMDELQWKFTWHPHCLHHAATSTRQKHPSSTLGHGHGNWVMYRQEKPAQKRSSLSRLHPAGASLRRRLGDIGSR